MNNITILDDCENNQTNFPRGTVDFLNKELAAVENAQKQSTFPL